MSAGNFLMQIRFDNSKVEDITGNTQWDYESAHIAYNDSPFGSKYKCCTTTSATEVDLKSIIGGTMPIPTEKGLTIAFWLYNLAGYTYSPKGYVCRIGQGDNTIFGMEPNYDGCYLCSRRLENTSVSNGTWHHIVVSCNKSIGKLFIDGQLRSTNTTAISKSDWILDPSSNMTTVSFFFVKGSSDSHNFFQGAIFDFAMIQAPIKNIANVTTLSIPTDYITADFTEAVDTSHKPILLKQY
jgi:hypothetical protein